MFERFTDRARRVIVQSQVQARALNHDWIGTEHLLLGLFGEGEGDGVAANALAAMGVSLDAARQAVEAIIPRGANPLPPAGHIPFTPRSKKVLELSLREALQLGHDYIGTEHILLGLLREGDGVGAQVLAGFGVDVNRAREQVTELLRGWRERNTPPSPADDELVSRLASVAARLSAIEQRLGPAPSG